MIALISDTHDNVEAIKKATQILRKRRIKTILHCGDVVAPKTIDLFKGFQLYLVHGNCDGDLIHLKQKVEEIKGSYLGDFGIVKIQNRKNKKNRIERDDPSKTGLFIAMYHGNNPFLLQVLKGYTGKHYNILCYGHTHKVDVEEIEQNDETNEGNSKALIINPGSLYEKEKSFALLNEDTLEVEIVKI